jgi:hypothetical protein
MYRLYTGHFSIVTLNTVIVATYVTANLQTECHKRHVAMFIFNFHPTFHTRFVLLMHHMYTAIALQAKAHFRTEYTRIFYILRTRHIKVVYFSNTCYFISFKELKACID